MTTVYETDQTNRVSWRPAVDEGGQKVFLAETSDFPYDDPWSELKRGVISGLVAAGSFEGRDIFEAGIGDGRNVVAAGFAKDTDTRLVGIELDDWRLGLARENLDALGVASERVSLHQGDIIDWLLNVPDKPLTGWGLACLPQAPRAAAENDADGYRDLGTLKPFRDILIGEHSIEDYGLTLNAAFLATLRKKVDPADFDVLITLSDRVPVEVLTKLFSSTGWSIANTHFAPRPIQQDPDTGIAWVNGFDDGFRFWEKDDRGEFVPISAAEAERRRLDSLSSGDQARENLNVHHGLSVYHLRPGEKG
jgi:hypothetical protein